MDGLPLKPGRTIKTKYGNYCFAVIDRKEVIK